MDTFKNISQKIIDDTFNVKLMDNAMRGIWAEYMVAEALGEKCKIVGRDWHAWDLQIGDDFDIFPNRIRLQLKNTARLQSWYDKTLKPSKCQWKLPISNKPSYFDEYHAGVPCEDYGHLCDLYVLCHHPIEDFAIADHRDVNQWVFYLLPVVGAKAMFEPYTKPEGQRSNPSYTVVPQSLRKGIRGRRPVEPVDFDGLTINAVKSALGIGSGN